MLTKWKLPALDKSRSHTFFCVEFGGDKQINMTSFQARRQSLVITPLPLDVGAIAQDSTGWGNLWLTDEPCSESSERTVRND